MASPVDLTGTRPLANVEGTKPSLSIGDARQETFNRLTQIALGKQLEAEILSLFDDGTFLVRVADTTARMALPLSTQVGDSLPMTLVATEPRPTFLLGAAASPSGATESLSPTGRLIDSLLQVARQDGTPPTVVGKAALVAAPAASAPQVATALHEALTYSGVFYESHLQQWTNGSRPLADLLREPQAQFARAVPPSAAPDTHAALLQPVKGHPDLAQLINSVREWAGGDRSLMDLIRESRTLPGDALHTDADTIAKPGTLSTESARIINVQLNTLEHRQVQWQGELWPGQYIEWQVSEEAPSDKLEDSQDGNANGAQSTWQSVVRFDLPTLGRVSATIHLEGQHVQIQVRTATEAIAATLRAHGAELAGAMKAAGSQLDALTIMQAQDDKA